MGNGNSHELIDEDVKPKTLKSRDLASVAQLIKDGKVKNVVVMTGAGISTSAGIPDFRSPETGLYANLARLDLPYAEAVFDISYFREHPKPFYALAHELYPGKYKPTVTHSFIGLLAKKGLLRMHFTQNIDCLDRAAGVPADKIVEAHGSFATQRCIECKTEFPDDVMHKMVMAHEVPHCQVPQCNGLVKPDIVFFGEQLPERFHDNRDVPGEADLAIIMGTSLTVQPFASLPQFVSEGVPRVLLNLERVGGLGSRTDDVCVLKDCDSGVRRLADELGWREELEASWRAASGKDEVEEKSKEYKSKDDELADEIEKLTSEVDQTLKVSNRHKEWLEKHLGDKKEGSDDGKTKGASLEEASSAPVTEEASSAPVTEEKQDAAVESKEIQTDVSGSEHITNASSAAVTVEDSQASKEDSGKKGTSDPHL